MQTQDTRRNAFIPYALVVGMWLVLHASLVFYHSNPVINGELADTDGYMRLLRITQLLNGGGWYDNAIARSNAPYGEVLHWTRPFDVLLLSLAAPLASFLGFDKALFIAGAAVSPLLQLLTAFAMIWAMAPLLRPGQWFLPIVALLLQPAVLVYSKPGQADHHAFQLFILALALGFVFRALKNRFDHQAAFLCGVLVGFGLWLSIEFLPAVVVCAVGIAFAWLVSSRERATQGLLFALGAVGVVVVGLLVERPVPEILTISYDRLSIVHLLLVGLVFVFWLGARLFDAQLGDPVAPWGRALFGGVYAVAGVAVLYLIFPAFFAGPMVDIDPRFVPIWLDKVSEMQPMLPNSLKKFGEFIFYFSMGLAAVPFLAWLVITERDRPDWFAWCGLSFAVLIFWPIAILHVRFATFAEIVFIIAAAELLDRVLTWAGRQEGDLKRGLLRGLVITIFLVGPSVLGTQLQKASGEGTVQEAKTGAQLCELPKIARFLEKSETWPKDERLTILAFPDFGPELLYRTRHRVIGTPYHRNGTAIYDSYRMLTTTEEEESLALMQARGVDLVLLCPYSPEALLFVTEDDRGTLYNRLLADETPFWLDRVFLPGELSEQFQLFSTNF